MNKYKVQILDLIKKNNNEKLEEVLIKNSANTLEFIEDNWESKEGPSTLRKIISCLCNSEKGSFLKYQIFETVLGILKNKDDCGKSGGELIAVLLIYTKSLSTQKILLLIESYITVIKTGAPFIGRWTELFDNLLSVISKREDIVFNGKAMSGEEFKYEILKSLCGSQWAAETTITLLTSMKFLNLSKDELLGVINHVKDTLKTVDLQSVPPIVYNLIILGQEHLPGDLLMLIMDYFNRFDWKKEKVRESSDIDITEESENTGFDNLELADAGGTVALHITHLGQYNPKIVKECLKKLKASICLSEKLITPFNLIVFLSLSSIDRFRGQVIDSLKSCLLKTFRQEQHEMKSLWMQEAFSGHYQLLKIFQQTLNIYKTGWLQISEGLITLCFGLLESATGGLRGDTYLAHQAVGLISKVFPLILKKEPSLAPQILKEVSCLIFTATNPLNYVDILSNLVTSFPALLLDHLNLLKYLLEYLSVPNTTVATALLHSLLPLIKLNATLKDSLMLILRKMLYSREVECRLSALEGYLLLLVNFRVLGALPSSQMHSSISSLGLSQTSLVDVHRTAPPNTNDAFCFELLGILRRCLSQQSQVRKRLYIGLYDVIRNNPKLATNILLILHQHLSQYVALNKNVSNPILFTKVIIQQGDSPVLTEPLAELLCSLALCRYWFELQRSGVDSQTTNIEDEEEDEEFIIKLLNDICSTFDILTEHFSHADLDDLGFGSVSFSQNDTKQRVFMQAEVLVGVLDALIQQNFFSGPKKSEAKMKTIITLFKMQRKIIDRASTFGRKAETSKRGKKGEPSKEKKSSGKMAVIFKSKIDIRVASEMIKVCLKGDNDDIESENAELLSRNSEFFIYLLKSVDETLESLKTLPPFKRKRLFSHFRTIAALLLKECHAYFPVDDAEDQREVDKLRHCLITLLNILSACNKYYKDKLLLMMKELSGKSPTDDITMYVYSIFKKCQDMLKRALFHAKKESFWKDALILVNIIKEITQPLTTNSNELRKMQDWLCQLIKDNQLDNVPVSEALVSLVLYLTDRTHSTSGMVRSLAKEIHSHLGDIDEEVSVEQIGKYKIVSEVTAPAILARVLSYMDHSLTLADIVLGKMKANILYLLKNDTDTERELSFRFGILIQSFSEIIVSAIPHGPITNTVIKLACKLYTSLISYIRYYSHLFKVKGNARIPEEFEKMISLSAKCIKNQLLKVLNYQHETHADNKKKSKTLLTARVNKESKLVPNLIFNMEQYEKSLLLLSKKSKVDMHSQFKLTTNRDFRIKMEFFDELDKDDNPAEEDEESNAEEPPTKKKRRKS